MQDDSADDSGRSSSNSSDRSSQNSNEINSEESNAQGKNLLKGVRLQSKSKLISKHKVAKIGKLHFSKKNYPTLDKNMNSINKVMDKEIDDIDLNKYTDYYVRFCIRQQNNFENCPLDNQIIL